MLRFSNCSVARVLLREARGIATDISSDLTTLLLLFRGECGGLVLFPGTDSERTAVGRGNGDALGSGTGGRSGRDRLVGDGGVGSGLPSRSRFPSASEPAGKTEGSRDFTGLEDSDPTFSLRSVSSNRAPMSPFPSFASCSATSFSSGLRSSNADSDFGSISNLIP